MPIYEFYCHQCGSEFEELVRSSGPSSDITCPECHGKDVEKKISAFAAPLFGSGSPGGKATNYWGGSSPSCKTGST